MAKSRTASLRGRFIRRPTLTRVRRPPSRRISSKVSRGISRTRTMHKKRKFKKLISEPYTMTPTGGVTTSSIVYKNKSNLKPDIKRLLKLQPEQSYISQSQGMAVADSGYQVVTQPRGNLTTGGDMREVQRESSLNNLEMYQGRLYSTTNLATYGSTANLIVNKASMSTMITNQSNATAVVKLYDVIHRKDSNSDQKGSSPYRDWHNLKAMSGGDANDETSYTNANNSMAMSASALHVIGATPFTEEAWCQLYKVAKVRTVYLLPGATHIHHQVSNPYRKFHYYQMKDTSSSGSMQSGDAVNPYGLAYLTTSLMIVAHGMPAVENGGSTVSTAPIKLSMISKFRYDFSFVNPFRNVTTLEDTLTTLATPFVFSDVNAATACDTI